MRHYDDDDNDDDGDNDDDVGDDDDGDDDEDEIGHKYRVWHLVHTTRGWEVRFTPMINLYSEIIIKVKQFGS